MTIEIIGARARVSAGLAAAGLLAAFVALAAVDDARLLPGELRLRAEVESFVAPRPWAGETLNFLLGVGAVPVVVVTVALAATWLVRLLGREAAWLAPAAALVALVARGLEELLGGDLPSGHAAYAAAMFGLLGYVAVRARRLELAAAALLVIVGVGFAMTARASHTGISTLAGYALGAAWLLALLLVWRPRLR